MTYEGVPNFYIPGEVVVVKNRAGAPVEFHYHDVDLDSYPIQWKIDAMDFWQAMTLAQEWGLSKMEFLQRIIWDLVHMTDESGKCIDGGDVVPIEKEICDVLDAAESNAIVDYVEYGVPGAETYIANGWYLSVLFPKEEAGECRVLAIWSCIDGEYSEKVM